MDFFTRRNIAILGLMQIGVLATGVLSAAACYKWYPLAGFTVPEIAAFWAEYGVLTLGLPVAWVVAGMTVVGRHEESADTRGIAVMLSGVGLLAAWLVVVWCVAVRPLAWIMLGGCGGLSS